MRHLFQRELTRGAGAKAPCGKGRLGSSRTLQASAPLSRDRSSPRHFHAGSYLPKPIRVELVSATAAARSTKRHTGGGIDVPLDLRVGHEVLVDDLGLGARQS